MNLSAPVPGTQCHWQGCERLATGGMDVELIPPGSRVARPSRVIALCDEHAREAETTGRINLAYHPDDHVPMGIDAPRLDGHDTVDA